MTPGCSGGRGEVRDDIHSGNWNLLATPSSHAKWVTFPRKAWLRWHWPSVGDMYAITITCEPPLHRDQLTLCERKKMKATGFILPRSIAPESEGEQEFIDADDEVDGREKPPAGGYDQQKPAAPKQRSAAAVKAAKRILGLESVTAPSAAEIEESFRRVVRAAHPDREEIRAHSHEAPVVDVNDSHAALTARMQGWAVAQVTWARKVLRDAVDNPPEPEETAEADPQAPLLMLPPNPPHLARQPPNPTDPPDA